MSALLKKTEGGGAAQVSEGELKRALKEGLRAIDSPKAAISFFEAVGRLARLRFSEVKGKDDLLPHEYFYSMNILEKVLFDLDLVKPLVRLHGRGSRQLKPDQIKRMLAILDGLPKPKQVEIEEEVFQLKNQVWDYLTQGPKVYLAPKRLPGLIDRLPEDNFLSTYLTDRGDRSQLNASMVRALAHLPAANRREAKLYLEQKMAAITPEMEKQSFMGMLPAGVGGPKVYRRNLETVHRVITGREIRAFTRELGTVRGKKTLVEQVDRFHARTLGQLAGGRGARKYSFDKVLAIASSLQRSLKPLLDDKNRYLVIYGSFPNGKARPESSDVDLLMGPGLGQEMVQLFDTGGQFKTFAKGVDKSPGLKRRAGDVQRLFVGAERAIARLLNRQADSKDELLGIRPEYTKQLGDKYSLFQQSNAGFYNPLSVKISRSKITVQAYDGLGAKKIVSVGVEAP